MITQSASIYKTPNHDILYSQNIFIIKNLKVKLINNEMYCSKVLKTFFLLHKKLCPRAM
jgi:hypothetical protein